MLENVQGKDVVKAVLPEGPKSSRNRGSQLHAGYLDDLPLRCRFHRRRVRTGPQRSLIPRDQRAQD